MKRSKFINGTKVKPNISKLLGKYVKSENGQVYYIGVDTALASDWTMCVRKRVSWPSDSLMKASCAWMPVMADWVELENGKEFLPEASERRINPLDKVANSLNRYDLDDWRKIK